MSLKLYEVSEMIEQAIESANIDQSTGEVSPEWNTFIDELQMEKEAKLKNIALHIKNMQSFSDNCESEIKKMQAKKIQSDNQIEFFKAYMLRYVDKSAKYPECSWSIRYSERTTVTNENMLPDAAFKVVPETKKISLTQVKDLILSGAITENVAKLVSTKSITIK
jgi:hypothetical protein